MPKREHNLPSRHYDEMHGPDGAVRAHFRAVADWLAETPAERVAEKRREADLLFHRVGITFAVYGETRGSDEGAERLIPFDTVPRVIPKAEWESLAKGLRQRVSALNRFLDDIYHDQRILKSEVIPAEQILCNEAYQVAMLGLDLPNRVYSHVAGIDLIRHEDGSYYVLEDNLRTPSGVSYMLENRKMMMRLFPELFARQHVHPVEHYPGLLLETLRASAPPSARDPVVAVLTPGQYNSAYFEHAFLAQQMGVELVEGGDLFVKDGFVHMRTTSGPQRVDVIYRRVDDAFLDPLAFRQDSLLGVPGMLSVYRAGNVALANALGTGVADDKSTYPYVPEMIRFYLGEEPILNNVPTWMCKRPKDLELVLDRMAELVVKEVQGSGGYGMLVGPAAKKSEVEAFRARVRANPANYIAQPTLSLSTCPTFVEQGLAPRHVDLRPYVLSGKEVKLVPGGLTRVALREGSLVVNSSQGGGTKDTWIVD
ncbi:MAG: circularly permuted type 2 ATP-grasp protein [Betaproteobacteria bacterium]|nr:circularly permuted type 2 ATP-grasp protein [Betaproteobacteria bacterium]